MQILIVPDKFKGTLTASAAAEAIALGWHKARPGDSLDLLPISDGGDGFGDAVGNLVKAKVQEIETVDASRRSCLAEWWWEPKSKTAVIESANVIGLTQLLPGKYHPFQLDTFGLGAVICAAADKGARRCIIGIGGSATNDGGFGLARALGWKFFDRHDFPITWWTELHRLDHICAPVRKCRFKELIVAVDVQNQLLGAHGATKVFGPQKGLGPLDLREAERNLRRLAVVCGRTNSDRPRSPFADVPGAGAAGGLGFGLMAFLGAKAEPGFRLFARLADLEKHLSTADLVITGEGQIDASTFMGKGVGDIGRLCRERKIPGIALAGTVLDRASIKKLFTKVCALTDLTTIDAAKSNPALWLQRLTTRLARQPGLLRT